MPALWLILDIETTGLDPGRCGVWQLGAVLWWHGLEIARFERLVRPSSQHWTPSHRARAREQSGLTEAEEALIAVSPGLPELPEALRILIAWLPQRRPCAVIATSYSLSFEQRFLDQEPAAISRQAREAGIKWRWGPCLMAAAVAALAPERERLSLEKACAALQIPWDGSHRALADARLAAAVGERLGVFTREEEASDAHPA